jgi:hypothetical protein
MKVRLTKQEKRDAQAEKVKQAFSGTGRFVYKNCTKGTLSLTKPAMNGSRQVAAGAEFEGDSYFMQFTRPPENVIAFVRVIESSTPEPDPTAPSPVLTEGVNMENKLILDQPSTVTANGTVEHVVASQTINEASPNASQKEVLLNETPLDGVEIIIGD